MLVTTYAAAALNAAVALIGLGLAALTPEWTADLGPAHLRKLRRQILVQALPRGFGRCGQSEGKIGHSALSLALGIQHPVPSMQMQGELVWSFHSKFSVAITEG